MGGALRERVEARRFIHRAEHSVLVGGLAAKVSK
jgi:hypothetical protein